MSDVHAREGSHARERCPFCHEEFAASSEERVACAGCGTPHHADCFAENGGCSSLGCERSVARVADGSEVPVARLPDEVRFRGKWDPVTLVLVGTGFLVALLSLVAWSPRPALWGLALWVFAALLRLYEWAIIRAQRAAAESGEPIASFRGPVDGVDGARRLNQTPRRTAPFPEPSGPPAACPSCGKTVEGTTDLAFCYHCGATLS